MKGASFATATLVDRTRPIVTDKQANVSVGRTSPVVDVIRPRKAITYPFWTT